MRKLLFAVISLSICSTFALADIHIPNKPGPTRKLGSGIAKTVASSAYVLDSFYDKLLSEGGTSAFTYGLVEGTGKAVYSTFLGVAEIVTFPLPKYEGFDRKYPTTKMPPADLYDNFY